MTLPSDRKPVGDLPTEIAALRKAVWRLVEVLRGDDPRQPYQPRQPQQPAIEPIDPDWDDRGFNPPAPPADLDDQ